ncbi:hypothetical protein [Novosphingobium sp.]|uniref:hypothetical protein n=1 Tax=Novosphingobium sp. TaxID=1874826 RepID=UPI003D147FF0
MSGIIEYLNDVTATASLGLAIPVTRGLQRYFLPGSADFNDLDLAGSGFTALLNNGPANNTREAHDIVPTVGPSYSYGGYGPNIALALAPPPPATLFGVGSNGFTLGNWYNDAQANITVGMDVISGAFGTNTQTKNMTEGGYNGPSITLDASYATQFKFYAVVQDWASGGNAKQTLYYGSGGTLLSATATQAAIAQSGTQGYPLDSNHGYNSAYNNSSSGSGQRKIAAMGVHNVALTAAEVAAHYAQFQRYFNGFLPNYGL